MSCRCGMQHSVGKIILVTLAIVTITFSQKESDNKGMLGIYLSIIQDCGQLLLHIHFTDSNDCIKDIISDPNKVTGE